MNTETIIRILEKYKIGTDSVQFLQCGSSIYERSARDFDIIVYTSCDLKDCYIELLEMLCEKGIFKEKFIENWNMYTFKIKEKNEIISFHIVSFEKLKGYVCKANKIETYTQINLFDLSLKLPTVYRKWILDTRPIWGNQNLKKELTKLLNYYEMPSKQIQSVLKNRINNSIDYFFEKRDSELFSGIVIGQIFNDLVLYCYAGNNKYYGTLKYIEDDLQTFENCKRLSSEGIMLFKEINTGMEKDIIKRLYKVKKILDEG